MKNSILSLLSAIGLAFGADTARTINTTVATALNNLPAALQSPDPFGLSCHPVDEPACCGPFGVERTTECHPLFEDNEDEQQYFWMMCSVMNGSPSCCSEDFEHCEPLVPDESYDSSQELLSLMCEHIHSQFPSAASDILCLVVNKTISLVKAVTIFGHASGFLLNHVSELGDHVENLTDHVDENHEYIAELKAYVDHLMSQVGRLEDHDDLSNDSLLEGYPSLISDGQIE